MARAKIAPAVQAISGAPIPDAVIEYYFNPPPVEGVDITNLKDELAGPHLRGSTIGGGGLRAR